MERTGHYTAFVTSKFVCPFCAPVRSILVGLDGTWGPKNPGISLVLGPHNAEFEGSIPSLTTNCHRSVANK